MVAEMPESTPSTRWIMLLRGELDLATGPPLNARIDRIMSGAPMALVLDLADIEFIDCYGLRPLVRAYNRYDNWLSLQRPSEPVRRVLQITGLLDVLPLLPDADAWPIDPHDDGGVRLPHRLYVCDPY